MMQKSQKSSTDDFLPQQQNELQTSIWTDRRPEYQNLADELSLAADSLAWSRRPELKECEAMAELVAAEGYYDMADLADASANERAQLFKRLAEGKSGRARALRKILDSKQLATEMETAYKEIDVSAAIKNRKHLSGLADILIPNQEAANLFSEELRNGKRALPPYTPFLLPKLNEAPWVAQDPDYKRARENEKLRQQRNGVKTLFMNSSQLSLAYLRYIVAGEVAGAWDAFGGMGAMLSHLAHLHKLSATQNMETSFRFERAQSAKWSQLARNRGGPEAIKADLRILYRESLAQCASDQLAEFNERKKGYEQEKQSEPTFPAYGKGGRRNRSRSLRRDTKGRYGKAH